MIYADAEGHAFTHAESSTRATGAATSATSRYLSGAAYVDQDYAETVLEELVGQSHRAIAPAVGYDLVTVIRHCLRARRLWLQQNIILTLILGVGVWYFRAATATVYVVCLLVYLYQASRRRMAIPADPVRSRTIARAGGLLLLLVVLLGCVLGLLFASIDLVSGASADLTYEVPDGGSLGVAVVMFPLGLIAVTVLLASVLTAYRYHLIGVISNVGRSQPYKKQRSEKDDVAHRLGVIDAAQRGNILLHADFEPFLGAGKRVTAWSIATELSAREPVGQNKQDPPSRVEIDPVDLIRHLRQRLAELRSPELLDQTRIRGLHLWDQVVSSSTHWQGYSLIDERVRLPYSLATAAAVDAIIRAPQANARYFLRVSVDQALSRPVVADGRTMMPAEQQSVTSSAFVHVSVEGGMLYVEVVTTVLGPIRQTFLEIDRHTAIDDRLSSAVAEAFRGFPGAVAAAPIRMVRGLYRRFRLVPAMRAAERKAGRPMYDFGCRFDVRELASQPVYANYLQRLDAEKYLRLIDRRVTEAIHEYLVEHDVDDSEFVAEVNFRQYTNTAITGLSDAQIAVGSTTATPPFGSSGTPLIPGPSGRSGK